MTSKKFEKMALVHDHRLSKGKQVLGQSAAALDALSEQQQQFNDDMSDLDALLAEADSLLSMPLALNQQAATQLHEMSFQLEKENAPPSSPRESISFEFLETIQFDENDTSDSLFSKYQDYAERNSLDLNRSLTSLLSREDIAAINKRLEDDFTYKNAKCDKYDYMIAGTAGVIGAIIDIFFVGAPGEGALTKMADSAVDTSVQQFAKLFGWKGPKEGKDPTKSAIGFLENFSKIKVDPKTGEKIKITHKINYDHRHGGDVGGRFPMSTKNHHIKSLGHSPDLVGLFFSILGQFTNTAYFVNDGKLISISSEFELRGGNFVAKVFSGFVNWLWHLFSDVAGSSGAAGRGSGIPIPFFGLLQFINVGEFGQYRQTFGKVCVQVFEQGYDFRHGLAMSIPVMVTELMIRIVFFIKQHFYHKKTLQESIPNGSIPELRRMLLVGHGTLCIFDAGDAALRSGGNMVKFLLRTNIIAWARFGFLALKELNAVINAGNINVKLIDAHIDREYQLMLGASK